MKKLLKKIGISGLGLTFAATSMGGLTAGALSQTGTSTDQSRYIAPLHPLNRSGVTGFANLSLNSEQPGAALTASVNARGTEPNQIHAIHIHGMLDGNDAECPTNAADVNSDKLVSVFEGAPFYGPIKISFTDPMTEFGPPANTTLFAPFAGAPVFTNFPKANDAGKVNYDKTISFDPNNQYAVQALASITPLEQQHIVVHGGFAPESVDTPGGDPNKIVYDALLPIACGPIIQTHKGADANVTHSQNENENNGSTTTTTGPNSTTTNNASSTTKTSVRNNNNVNASTSSNQRSSTGNSNVSGNTNGGTATSGSATNSSSNSFILRIWNSITH